jgi:hypothetical protein
LLVLLSARLLHVQLDEQLFTNPISKKNKNLILFNNVQGCHKAMQYQGETGQNICSLDRHKPDRTFARCPAIADLLIGFDWV